jgi:cytochrome c2
MRRSLLLVPIAAALLAAGCGSGAKSPELVPGGDASAGKSLIHSFGCGGCHTIPGIPGASARVGPDLSGFRSRRYIAGELRNTPENATRWIEHPKSVEPGTIMPDLGVSRSQALDIVAYLYGHT